MKKLVLKRCLKYSARVCLGFLLLQNMSVVQAATQLTYKESQGKEYQVYISENRIGSHEGFYDLDKDNFVMIEHGAKTYSVISRSELNSLIVRSQQVLAQMETLGAYLPPEYQGTFKDKTRVSQLQSYTLNKTGQAKVARYTCDQFQIIKDQKVEGEACIADAAQLNLPKADMSGLNKAIYNIQGLIDKLPGISPDQQQQFDLFKEGIPLSVKTQDGKNWALKAVKASDKGLYVPKGYTYKQFSLVDLTGAAITE